ncbi:MAG TPA: hypothetical protein VJK51_02870 [Candidatus Nanoarchaeia archaeon]|nr:hypothetical protein [Candidatus Nanoarchaeia archaeon]
MSRLDELRFPEGEEVVVAVPQEGADPLLFTGVYEGIKNAQVWVGSCFQLSPAEDDHYYTLLYNGDHSLFGLGRADVISVNDLRVKGVPSSYNAVRLLRLFREGLK